MKTGKLLPYSFWAAFCGPAILIKQTLFYHYHSTGMECDLRSSTSILYLYINRNTNYCTMSCKKCKGYFISFKKKRVIDVNDAWEYSMFIFYDVFWDSHNKRREYFSICLHKTIGAAYLFQIRWCQFHLFLMSMYLLIRLTRISRNSITGNDYWKIPFRLIIKNSVSVMVRLKISTKIR